MRSNNLSLLLPASLLLSLTACSPEERARWSHPTDPTVDWDDTDTQQPGDDTAEDTGEDTGEPAIRYPSRGMFVDAPVAGLSFEAGGLSGTTAVDGRFDYFAGEPVVFSLGNAVLGEATGYPVLTPLSLVPGADLQDPAVGNLARFLQSLDQDGDLGNGIWLSPDVEVLVDEAMAELELSRVDWGSNEEVDGLLDHVIEASKLLEDHDLVRVDSAAARAHLKRSLDEWGLFTRNISGTPLMETWKVKIDALTVYVAGRTADGTPTGEQVTPLVSVYGDEIEGTGGIDTFAAISLDEGDTWKRFNLSQSADDTSFTLADGTPYPGTCDKANIKTAGRNMLITWTSKYCPAENPAGWPEAQDVYGVAGAQDSVDYTLQGLPGLGERPYSCLWVSRGQVAADGSIHFLKAEQVTSGVRDATEEMVAGTNESGFAVVWQEDPLGLKPGEAGGSGHGLSGASVNHGTDIWYSYLPWADFARTDESYDPSSDPDAQTDDGVPRARARVPMSMPVRLTDNAPCKWHEEEVEGEAYCEEVCASFDDQGNCLTEAGVALTGKTGASRANVATLPKTRTLPDGSIVRTAQVLAGYEESKGGDSEAEDTEDEGEGKYIIYHTFDLDKPDKIAAGTIMSDPELSARRIRFVPQPTSNVGPADLRVVMLYRQGLGGCGYPADIMMRRAIGGYGASSFLPAVNLSSPYLIATRPYGDEGDVQAIAWSWTEDSLQADWEANPYDNAKAHRAQVRGDFVAVGFTWTANELLSRKGDDHYDFFIRRSFDGGATWTDAAGEYESPRNLSNLPDDNFSVVEPRIVGTPGTIKNPDGTPTGNSWDIQNPSVFFVAWGIQLNNEAGDCPDDAEELDVGDHVDLFFGRTADQGETYNTITWTDPETGEMKPVFGCLACGPGSASESQLRATPDGSQLSASWFEASEDETSPRSDAWFRRVYYPTEPGR